MDSVIVNKFYSKLERLGFKKHKVTNREIKYLDGLSKINQCQEFCNESNFNIDRLKIKIKILRFIIYILVIFLIFFIISELYWLFLGLFLTIGFMLLFMRYFKNKMNVYLIIFNIFNDAKYEDLIKYFK